MASDDYSFALIAMKRSERIGLLKLRGAGHRLAGNFRRTMDRLAAVGLSRREIFIIWRISAVTAKMGFTIPLALALWITFDESSGAHLIGCGFLARLLAASAALGMAGALYTSVRLGEDWLRAALYLIIFTALV